MNTCYINEGNNQIKIGNELVEKLFSVEDGHLTLQYYLDKVTNKKWEQQE